MKSIQDLLKKLKLTESSSSYDTDIENIIPESPNHVYEIIEPEEQDLEPSPKVRELSEISAPTTRTSHSAPIPRMVSKTNHQPSNHHTIYSTLPQFETASKPKLTSEEKKRQLTKIQSLPKEVVHDFRSHIVPPH